jgi:hypothetical protein
MDHLESTRASDYFTPWLNTVVREADIVVDPTIGSWSFAGVGILPPEN